MRIEINAGGLNGFGTVSQFADAVDVLDDKIKEMLSTFQIVKKAISNLSGGIGALEGAYDSIEARIKAEKQKRDNLSAFADECEDFIDLALRKDRSAATKVTQNRVGYYLSNFKVSNCGACIVDGFSVLGSWLLEFHDEVILFGTSAASVIGGTVLVVGTIIGAFAAAPALAVIGGVALVVAGVASIIGGVKSMADDGDIGFGEWIISYLIGAASGACIGACGYAICAISTSVAATAVTWGTAAKVAGAQAGISMSLDVLEQTVFTANEVGFANYSLSNTIWEGSMSFMLSMFTFGVLKMPGVDKFVKSAETGAFKMGLKYIGNPWMAAWMGMFTVDTITGIGEGALDTTISLATGRVSKDEILPHFGKSVLQNIIINVILNAGKEFITWKSDMRMFDQWFNQTHKPGEIRLELDPNDDILKKTLNDFELEGISYNISGGTNAVRDALTYRQSVPVGVDETFTALSPKVQSIDSNFDLFANDLANLDMNSILNKSIGGDKVSVRLIDLNSKAFQGWGSSVSDALSKQINSMAPGETLRVVVPNISISIPQLQGLNSISDVAEKAGIAFEIYTPVITKGK